MRISKKITKEVTVIAEFLLSKKSSHLVSDTKILFYYELQVLDASNLPLAVARIKPHSKLDLFFSGLERWFSLRSPLLCEEMSIEAGCSKLTHLP